MIEASHFDAGTAYAAMDRHRLDDYAPLHPSHARFRKSWEKIAVGHQARPRLCAPCARIRSARACSMPRTEMGVYVSFNDGDSWLPLQLNLPVAPVHDLVVHDDDLVIATHGRSFWILDDLTPLRQITPELADNRLRICSRRRPRCGCAATSATTRRFRRKSRPGRIRLRARSSTTISARRRRKSRWRFWTAAASWCGGSRPPTSRSSRTRTSPSRATGSRRRRDWRRRPGEHRFVWDLRYPDPPSLRKNYDLSAVYGSRDQRPATRAAGAAGQVPGALDG